MGGSKVRAGILVAACVAGLAVGVEAWAEAPVVAKGIEAKVTKPPFGCDPARLSYVIDSGNLQMCNGRALLAGPGWKNYPWPGLVQGNYFYVTRDTENGTESAAWLPTITVPGRYEVWVSYRGTENRTSAAPFYVFSDENVTYGITVDQRAPDGTFFVKLGTFFFAKHALDESPRVTGAILCRSETLQTSEAVDAAFVRYVGPGTPAGLAASDGAFPDRVELTWQRVPGARGYRVYRGATSDVAGAQQIGALSGGALTAFVDTPLEPGRRFHYWVKAVGALGTVGAFSRRNAGSTAPAAP